jgi:hypothetical protein
MNLRQSRANPRSKFNGILIGYRPVHGNQILDSVPGDALKVAHDVNSKSFLVRRKSLEVDAQLSRHWALTESRSLTPHRL